MKDLIVTEDFAILPGAKALVTFSQEKDGAKIKNVVPYEPGSEPYSRWGDNNLFPQEVMADLEKNSVALRALDKRRRVHFGRGILAYREKTDASGNIIKEPVRDPEITEFFRLNRVNFQWTSLIYGMEIFANGWLEMILNKGKDRINRVFVKDPAYCRLSRMDPDGKIRKLYYSAQWDRNPSPGSEEIAEMPMFDAEKFKNGIYPDVRFAYQLNYSTFNRSYYAMAIWNSIRANKWMDIANRVPVLKAAIMKNQMTIKYHIVIPHDYFLQRYPNGDYTKEQREKKITEVMEQMNDFLADVENSGKAFVSFAFYNKAKQEMLEGWRIETIDNKLQDSAYLPDSQAANSEILFAIGVDPCLIGAGLPGGKLGAGSGSDKREAYWMLNADMGPDRQITLDPLYFIRDINGWPQDIQFDYVTVDTSQTQDQHPTKTEKRIDQNQQ